MIVVYANSLRIEITSCTSPGVNHPEASHKTSRTLASNGPMPLLATPSTVAELLSRFAGSRATLAMIRLC